ncbi:FAD-dependent oxidoreductase [Microbacterium sp. ET2]|uniref:FAD-dependent oxidoreductase n=1 Tax=Microbacterium albipurpureum TaxID=3050384 RepID=UPI00259D08A2|nr:FAD-dependent oxidoreductase [Microbacterium sp. ET2 (Ac-2212)]WJL96613.1 FAD-dependent oxidoreductase [Microbacterium sp. ET2 (Ac-2212)]
MTNDWDAVIIGGGVAGLSAAQMLGRSRRRTLVIDSGRPRNRFAAHMHGVLGQDGTDPVALLTTGRAEAEAYGVMVVEGTVSAVTDAGDRLHVRREDGSVDTARVAIIATGVRDDLPKITGLAGAWGETVLHCPYCHGWEVAGRRLGVLMTSPMSAHQAQLVRQLSADVTAFTALAEPLDDHVHAAFVARGIRVVAQPVRRVDRVGTGLALTTEDGIEHRVDALFTGGAPMLNLDFAHSLELSRSEAPGSPLIADVTGATSHPRVFAAGNAVSPFANVPVSMGSGAMAGAGANARLTEEDVDLAITARAAERNAGWEERYAAQDRFWSGRVNSTVAAIAGELEPGSVLDVGSGEGGDVVWLAERGWRATGVDVSATAVQRATRFAADRGVNATFVVGDGVEAVDDRFDLVLASFLHSWEPDFPRIRILRAAAERVAPGGRLLVVSHAGPPPWAPESAEHVPNFRTPEEELALLDLDDGAWHTETLEIRRRDVTAPDGSQAHLEDAVLMLRRAV